MKSVIEIFRYAGFRSFSAVLGEITAFWFGGSRICYDGS